MSAMKTAKNFVLNARNNGKAGLVALDVCLKHVEEHADWTPLAWVLAKLELKDARIMRRFLGEIVVGVKLETTSKRAKDQPSGVYLSFAPNWRFTNKYAVLGECIKDGLSFRSADAWDRIVGEMVKPDFDLAHAVAAYERLLKKLDDGGLTIAQVLKAVEGSHKVNADLEPTKVVRANGKIEPVKAA